MLWLGFVANFEEVGAAARHDVKGYMVLLPSDAVLHEESRPCKNCRTESQKPADNLPQ